MRTVRRIGLLVGLGVIAALGVLSFRALWMPAGPGPVTALPRGAPPAPRRTQIVEQTQAPQRGEPATEPAEPDSSVPLDARETALGEAAPRRASPLSHAATADDAAAPDRSTQPPTADAEQPSGWCFHTTLDHVAVSDTNEVWSGSRSVVIKELGPVAESALRVNALWQAVDGTPYRNARVQLTVHVKGGGGLFVFLHGATNEELSLLNGPLTIASSNNRYVSSIAATGWTELTIVGDIPADADVVFFGVAQNGRASLWVDDVRVAKVGVSLPVTSTASGNAPLLLPPSPGSPLPEPANLDFEITTESSEVGAASTGAC